MPSAGIMPGANSATREFVQKLKHATAENHQQLEQCQLSRELMSPDVNKASYLAYLAALAPVLHYTDHIVYNKVPHIISDMDRRHKYPLIKNDIETIAPDFFQNSHSHNTYEPAAGKLQDFTALAHIYVMEGSTLGGKFISRHIFEYLELDAHNGASYFNCYGDLTGVLWKSFLDPFATYAIDNNKEDEIITAANEVFSGLSDHFVKCFNG